MSNNRERGEPDIVGRTCDALEEMLRKAEAAGQRWECESTTGKGKRGQRKIVFTIGWEEGDQP